MKTALIENQIIEVGRNLSLVTGSHRRVLEEIFHRPSSHNLGWRDVILLMKQIGDAHEKGSNQLVFEIAGIRHVMHKSHTKDLTSPNIIELRHFLTQARFSPELSSQPVINPVPAAPSLLVVVDHHEARVFEVDITSDDETQHVIRPYDPHHFLHHLVHKDQSCERGQRAPEESAYYKKIAEALALGGEIVLVGHGTGKSNAAHHLTEY